MASRHRENYLTLPIADFCNKIGTWLPRFDPFKPIERALQAEGGGVLIDPRCTLLTTDIGGNQLAFDRGGGQPLIPQRDRQLAKLGEIARKGAGCLRARAFAAVHVDGKPEYEAGGRTLGRQREQRGTIDGELSARDGGDTGRQLAVRI